MSATTQAIPMTPDDAQREPTKEEQQKFEKDFRQLLQADLEAKDAKVRLDEAKGPVHEYVQCFGSRNRAGTDQRLVEWQGWKAQHTCRQGKPKIDEEARLSWCQEHYPDAIVMRPAVDEETWAGLIALKKIPAKVLAEIQTDGVSYYLRWWRGGTVHCPKCAGSVNANDQFCKHCGLNLGEAADKAAGKKVKAKAKSKKK